LLQLDLAASFIIHGLRQRQGDDVDVTVVGPIGIWVFEVKFWSGPISYRNGKWDYGGQHPERQQDPDKQWRRMADDVATTLLRRDGFLCFRVPEFKEIHGGIVFAYPGARPDIVGCPAKWGTTKHWQERLMKAEFSPRIDEADVLAVLEALLSQHQGVEPERIRSMEAYAEQIVQESVARLDAWTRE
jgi:hypothetical protein